MQTDDDVDYLEDDQRVFNEKLEREGGVFLEPERTQVDCNSEESACAPDDYPEDPYSIDNRPGTPDDIGYSFGLASRDAADRHVIAEGRTHRGRHSASGTDREAELGEPDESELWGQMERLVEEDASSGVRLPQGMSEEAGERVLEATSDDAENVFDTSATAEDGTGPEHGGFPGRDG